MPRSPTEPPSSDHRVDFGEEKWWRHRLRRGVVAVCSEGGLEFSSSMRADAGA